MQSDDTSDDLSARTFADNTLETLASTFHGRLEADVASYGPYRLAWELEADAVELLIEARPTNPEGWEVSGELHASSSTWNCSSELSIEAPPRSAKRSTLSFEAEATALDLKHAAERTSAGVAKAWGNSPEKQQKARRRTREDWMNEVVSADIDPETKATLCRLHPWITDRTQSGLQERKLVLEALHRNALLSDLDADVAGELVELVAEQASALEEDLETLRAIADGELDCDLMQQGESSCR